jgi:hypothetical protein
MMSRMTVVLALAILLLAAAVARAGTPRERAIEQIPELMGRILESQEEIREREKEMQPVVERFDRKLESARRDVEHAGSEENAAEALVDYVEAYASRLEAQEEGLRAIQPSVVRMRADARELAQAARMAGAREPDSPEARKEFFADQFQGVASGMSRLAGRLGREQDASTAGALLNASWASHESRELPLKELGSDGALAFSRRVEGLYARYYARSRQLQTERVAVRRLLDVLIERQLARRLDTLFAGDDGLGLSALLAGEGKGEDWGDLGSVVGRALGLPAGGGSVVAGSGASLDQIQHFARGGHRE